MLTMAEVEAAIHLQVTEIAEIRRDIEWVHCDLVSRHYPVASDGEVYGFGHTCQAYVMLCFARIDAISMFWAGGKSKRNPLNIKATDEGPQTERIVAFLDEYYPERVGMHRLAVQLWRHTLMHEGVPHELTSDAGDHYQYVLIWHWHDPDTHYTLMTEPATSTGNPFTLHIFRMGVLRLVADVERMVGRYCADLRAPQNGSLRETYEARETERRKPVKL